MRLHSYLFLVLMMLSLFAMGQARRRNKVTLAKPEDDKIQSDTFCGTVLSHGQPRISELILHHCRYCDEGTFSIAETGSSTHGGNSFLSKGEWTVLRGSAKDENATVVEIVLPAGDLFFLRRKGGILQQLDSRLNELKPVNKYLLRKQ